MIIAGQRFGKHVPVATNRRVINTRCYEGRYPQTNSVVCAFPWQQRGNRQFPWLQVAFTRCRTEKESVEALYILYIQLVKICKKVNTCTTDNWLKPVTMTDRWQTRPLVREGAPYGQDNNFQGRMNIGSWALDGARHQDRQTDWPSVAMWLWLWGVSRSSVVREFSVQLWSVNQRTTEAEEVTDS
jgi:hypothetical protein